MDCNPSLDYFMDFYPLNHDAKLHLLMYHKAVHYEIILSPRGADR